MSENNYRFFGVRNKEKEWYSGIDINRVAVFTKNKDEAVPYSFSNAKLKAEELLKKGYEILDFKSL